MSSYRPSEPEDLLLSQRNELFQIAFDAGFLSTDFEWTTTSSDFTGIFGTTVPMLVHAPSKFYFKFGFRDDWRNPRPGAPINLATEHRGPHCLEYSPGRETVQVTAGYNDWFYTKAHFREWLGHLRREVTQVDVWAGLQGVQALTVRTAQDNEPFSVPEQRALASALDDVRSEIHKHFALTTEQLTAVHATLNEMKDASTRLGRKDWLLCFLGAWASWAVTSLVPADQAQNLLMFVSANLTTLWNRLVLSP